MKERPILFSAPMVRAILAGPKTQTRRAWRDQPPPGVRVGWTPESTTPYGKAGDRLWVREAFRLCAEADATPPRDTDAAYRVWYEADAPHQPGFGKLRPGMFMPRWASRITLEVTGVRVERLQEISAADAIAEGIGHNDTDAAVADYAALWERINGPGSWDANPWVWVVQFKRA